MSAWKGFVEGDWTKKVDVRDFIIKNFEVNQDIIKLKDLQNFDGVFITNALRGVQFANEFNNINFKCTNVIKNIISKITEIGF